MPFGTKSPESFADAESYLVVSTADKPLYANAMSCEQGLSNDESWQCEPFLVTHKVCGHFGVFQFLYPNFVIDETAKSISMTVRRTGGGYGSVMINYFIKHFTTDDSDLVATAAYTTSQSLQFDDGVIQRTFKISILDDNIVEENEVFQVVLEIPEGGGSVGAQFRANVTIIDDDSMKIAPKLSKIVQNSTVAVANESFAVFVQAVAANGNVLNTGGERFFAIVENDLSAWRNPSRVRNSAAWGGSQRHSRRHVCSVTDSESGLYKVFCPGIEEQGNYQLRVYHCFPDSIKGEYFYDGFFDRRALVRLDHYVNFTWGTGRLIPRGSDYISVRWTGLLLPDGPGEYQFKVEADDNARLWINGDLILDHFHEAFVNLEPSRNVTFHDSSLQEIVIEYRELTGEAHARFMWGKNGGELHVVPQSHLLSPFELDISPVAVKILSTETDPSKTECTGQGLFAAVARRTSHFRVCPRDTFRNLRDDVADDFYLSSELFSASLTLLEGDENRGVGVEVVAVSLMYNSDLHCFEASYTPQRAGYYRLDVVFQSWHLEAHQPVAGSPFFLTVAPDKTSGPQSLIFGMPKPLYMDAGSCFNFTVIARDNNLNLRLVGGDDLMVRTNHVCRVCDKFLLSSVVVHAYSSGVYVSH